LGARLKVTPERQFFPEPLSLSKYLLGDALVVPEAGLAAERVERS
jgi:hypothetical protein